MKKIIFFIIILLSGCTPKDEIYYIEFFKENKADFLLIKNKLNDLLDQKDSLFKFNVIFTGKLLFESPYINDTTQFNFYNLKLEKKSRDKIQNIMYNMDLSTVSVYRDSCYYVYKGRFKDTIIIFNQPMLVNRGILIDTNTYLVFANDQ